VTGGNVSFYNRTGEVNIHPTPLVGVLGVMDDVAARTPMAWSGDGQIIYLLGQTRDEFGGSEWAHVVHGHLGGRPPAIDLAAERTLGQVLVAGSRAGIFTAAHDVSDGGVAITLAEMALRAGVGAKLAVPQGTDPFVFWFSESATRAVVVVSAEQELAFEIMCAAANVPVTQIGLVDPQAGADAGLPDDQALVWDDILGERIVLPLQELRQIWSATLPGLFG
jgi:phosphoribosylformylglycinamidine synthase